MIVNVRASRAGARSAVHEALRASVPRADFFATASLDELSSVAARAIAEQADAVVLAGGDGSWMRGTSALVRAFERLHGTRLSADAPNAPPAGTKPFPVLGLVAAGTVNTVAGNVRAASPSRPGLGGPKGACALVRGLRDGRVLGRPHATLRVRSARNVRPQTSRVACAEHHEPDEHVEHDEHVGFIFGAGLVGRFFELYDAAPRRGILSAARLAAEVFVGAHTGSALARRVLTPAPCALAVDGDEAEARAFSLVAASVVQNLGLNLRLTYRAGGHDGRFHVVASPLEPRALAAQLPNVLTGRALGGAGHVDALARSLSVRFPADDAFVLDGDLFSASRIEVEAGPVLRIATTNADALGSGR